jgi:hypothetical protein
LVTQVVTLEQVVALVGFTPFVAKDKVYRQFGGSVTCFHGYAPLRAITLGMKLAAFIAELK